jgi:hypothetical protein
MTASRLAALAFAALVGIGALATSPGEAAAAVDLSFLNHMNPEYRRCVNNTQAQLQPQHRNDRKIHDAIIDACSQRFKAFGR